MRREGRLKGISMERDLNSTKNKMEMKKQTMGKAEKRMWIIGKV